MNYNCALEKRDYARIDKLNALTDINTYWGDVKEITKGVRGDHSLERWGILTGIRYNELVRQSIGNDDVTPLLQLFDRTMRNCLFYEKEGKTNCLLNEIGVLRGIDYVLCEVGYFFHITHKDLYRLIDIQNEMLKAEK